MKIENSGEKLLNAYEVKKLLKIPLSTIYYLTQTGALKSIRFGKHIRYRKEDIENYLENGLLKARLPEIIGSVDRREYPRIKCEIECIVKVDLPRFGNVDVTGIVQDISVGGLCLDVMQDKQIQTDYPVNVSFRLNKEEVELSGRVVRMDDNGVAVKYRNIPESIKEKINRYVG